MKYLILLLLFLSSQATAGVTIPTDPVDSDGNRIVRIKQTVSGWSFQFKSFEFTTCTLSNVVSKDYLNADANDVTIKIYNAGGTEITDQATANTDCTKTVVDFEPLYDYEIIGGMLSVITSPTSDIFLHIVAVPDLPAGSGGTKVFTQNFNTRFLGAQETLKIDGRASKRLNYNASFHTNKIRLILYSDAGVKHRFMQSFEIFKQ